MSRSRAAQRLNDFETRSVQLIAVCALGLAGIVSVQVSPPTRQALAAFTPSRQGDAPRPTRLSAEVASALLSSTGRQGAAPGPHKRSLKA